MSLPIIEAIQNNINNLKNTKQDIKNAINTDYDFIADEQIGSYPNLIKQSIAYYKNRIPHQTVEGTELKLNTIPLKFDNIKIKGNTEQKNTDIINEDEYNSPSPDYPQDIHIVTGNNTIEIQGKNLFSGLIYSANRVIQNNGNLSYNANNNVYQTLVKANQKYTIAITSTDEQYQRDCRIIAYDSEGNFIGAITTFNIPASRRTTKTFTTPDNAGIIRYHIQKLSKELQLEHGSIATDYTPYIETQNYSFNLGSLELCKIGDYQDYLYKENGNWYKYNNIGKIILNGNEGWDVYQNAEIKIFRTNVESAKDSEKKSYLLSNYFKQSNILQSYGLIRNQTQNYYNLEFTIENILSVVNFKAWLSTHNTKVYYPLKTPTVIQITDKTLISQLNVIEKIKGNNEITITTSGDDLAPIFNATAYIKEVE